MGIAKQHCIQIELNYCKQCGICAEFCPAEVFEIDPDGYPVARREGACTGCRLCELRCPDFALEVVQIG